VAERGIEVEAVRDAIWEVDVGNGEHHIIASGLRNPNGMAWKPSSGAQWRVVNGHDVLRSYLVPDTLGSVCDGGCYGPTAATARRSINASSRSGPSWCPATSAMCCGA